MTRSTSSCLGLRRRQEPELIACPTCGRIEIDLIRLVGDVRRRLEGITVPVKVAVMGCVVNGPGEAEGADVAVFAGRGRGVIYVQGRQVRTVTEAEMLDALCAEVEAFAERVRRGEAQLSDGVRLDIPPDVSSPAPLATSSSAPSSVPGTSSATASPFVANQPQFVALQVAPPTNADL